MSFDWSEFVGFAQNLIGDPETHIHGQEAKFRAAISRAYYGAYGTAAEKLKGEGHTLPRDSVHKTVIERFRTSPDSTRQAIASELDTLRKERVKADYRPRASITLATAQFANALASLVIQRINTV
jgi:hypothetical protein